MGQAINHHFRCDDMEHVTWTHLSKAPPTTGLVIITNEPHFTAECKTNSKSRHHDYDTHQTLSSNTRLPVFNVSLSRERAVVKWSLKVTLDTSIRLQTQDRSSGLCPTCSLNTSRLNPKFRQDLLWLPGNVAVTRRQNIPAQLVHRRRFRQQPAQLSTLRGRKCNKSSILAP